MGHKTTGSYGKRGFEMSTCKGAEWNILMTWSFPFCGIFWFQKFGEKMWRNWSKSLLIGLLFRGIPPLFSTSFIRTGKKIVLIFSLSSFTFFFNARVQQSKMSCEVIGSHSNVSLISLLHMFSLFPPFFLTLFIFWTKKKPHPLTSLW